VRGLGGFVLVYQTLDDFLGCLELVDAFCLFFFE
jgi:hypothetical protein